MAKALEERVKAIPLRPLTLKDRELFFNREGELRELQDAVKFYEGSVIGLAGERGSGKTSLINMAAFQGKEKVTVNVVDRESRMAIILNLIEGIAEEAKRKGWGEVERKALLAVERLTTSYQIRGGVKAVVEASVSRKREVKTLQEAVRLLQEVVEALAKRRAVVVVDEIDKEKKEEVLLILDTLKYPFLHNATTLVVTLPAEIYRDYLLSKGNAGEAYNLENVITHMVVLEPLSQDVVEKMIYHYMGRWIERGAVELLVRYGRGNPRRVLSTLKEAGIVALRMGKEKVGREDVAAVVRRYLKAFLSGLRLSVREREVLENLKGGRTAEVVEELEKKVKMGRESVYKYLQRLQDKGLLTIEQGQVFLEDWVALARELGVL